MNVVILIGRLTREPELRFTPNGIATCIFDIAVDRPGEKKEVDFIRIISWQKTAENCANYLGKGRMVAVRGRLQIRSYDDKDGQKRWVSEVVANQVQFLDRGKDEKPPENKPEPANDDMGGINLDELGF